MIAVNAMNKDQRYKWVANLLAEMFELDGANLSPESNLYADLDIDSIDAVDLAVKLKQMTGMRIAPEVFKKSRREKPARSRAALASLVIPFFIAPPPWHSAESRCTCGRA